MVAHISNSSTGTAEAGGSKVQSQPGLLKENLSQKKKKKLLCQLCLVLGMLRKDFANYLPVLTSNCDPPDLYFPSSLDYRHESLVPGFKNYLKKFLVF
jgi:hypothetical protein